MGSEQCYCSKANILQDGLDILCDIDKDIRTLITPRIDEITALLERYISEIELFNAAYGLVSVSDTKELVIKHILDSLAPLGIIMRLLNETNNIFAEQCIARHSIADAGSGAGLPGIPLAIVLPNCDFTLIERMGRRANFLCNIKAILKLSNVTVEESELEKTAPGKFDLVTFRAFKPLEQKLLKTLFNAAKKQPAGTGAAGGIIAAYKGRRGKIEQEMAPLKNACRQWEAIPCRVPFLDEERHLLVIRN